MAAATTSEAVIGMDSKAEESEESVASKAAASVPFSLFHKRGDEFHGIKQLAEFVESASESERKAMAVAWTESMRGTVQSTKARLGQFLHAVVALYLIHLKRTDAEGFGDLIMFEATDDTWLHYAQIMARLLMGTETVDVNDFDSVLKGVVEQFVIWQVEAEKHHMKLLELTWERISNEWIDSLSEEFKKYYAAHRKEVDANALWKHVIDPKQDVVLMKSLEKQPNVEVFRFLATELPPAAMKYWDCDARAVVTPMSVAVEKKCAPLISCIDAYIGDSVATRVARRSAESDSLAKSTLRQLREECGGDEKFFKRTMQCIVRTVIKQIKASVAFSPDLFAMCDWWQRTETQSPRSSVMETLLLKAENILKCETVAKESVQWHYAEHYFVNENTCLPVFLEEARAKRIATICKNTLQKEEEKLVAEMQKCAAKDTEAYTELCDGSTLKSTPESERWKWRQDTWFLEEGLNQPKTAETALEDLSTADFNAKAMYDVSSYLNERLTDAHALDGGWKDAMKGLTKTHSLLKNALLQFGPVKGATRCRAKAAEDKKSKWPKTAAIIDLTRCSLTFDDASDYVAAIKLFKDDICTWKKPMAEAKTDDGDDSGLLPLELVRIKNGFNKLDGANLEVPKGFCDVKLNVVIRGVVNGEKHAVIGEIQFLLRPILESKKAGHKIYEVKRNASGLMADARTARATRFSEPKDIVLSAQTPKEMTRALFHHWDSAQFSERKAVVEATHGAALVSGSQPSLLRFVAQKLSRVPVAVARDESAELFPAEMLQRIVVKRAADDNLADCLQEIRKLVGGAPFDKRPFDKRLLAEVRPMDAYTSHCPAEVLSEKTLRLLMPSSLSRTEACDFWKQSKCGLSALKKAALSGNVAAIKVLLSLGVDAKERDADGRTAVYYAAYGGHVEAVKLLSENGVDVNTSANDGRTPVFIAAQLGHIEVVNELISLGADLNKAMPGNGNTPLCIAALKGFVPVVNALIAGGADPNLAKKNGCTAVYIAAEMGHIEVIRALILWKADLNIARNDGLTPVFIAAEKGLVEVVSVLISGGADANKARNDGGTPLMIAASFGRTAVVSLLLESGVDVLIKDYDHRDALYCAHAAGHEDIESMLSKCMPQKVVKKKKKRKWF